MLPIGGIHVSRNQGIEIRLDPTPNDPLGNFVLHVPATQNCPEGDRLPAGVPLNSSYSCCVGIVVGRMNDGP